jgi:2-C-methyl-D-erythritol 4-phosphate cytidylyltransferase
LANQFNQKVNYWVAIPAAGVGARMGGPQPKQYLPLYGKTVIEHTIGRFARHPAIHGIAVAIAKDDPYWNALSFAGPARLWVTEGGAERCHSVLSALRTLAEFANSDDWVLVHDAARPCIREKDINRLIEDLNDHTVGGLLALPVRDTIKRGSPSGEVIETVDRRGLWQALTPQMFRLGVLMKALEQALSLERLVTDEAEAMELYGLSPLLVEGSADNIKITRPEDLALAELYLRQQEEEETCG